MKDGSTLFRPVTVRFHAALDSPSLAPVLVADAFGRDDAAEYLRGAAAHFFLTPYRAEHAASVELQHLGGRVITSARKPVWFWKLFGDDVRSKVVSLFLSGPQVGAKELQQLKFLPELAGLYLDDTNVTDDCLVYIESLKKLRDLSVRRAGISRSPQLDGMSRLQGLDLAFTDVSEIDLSGLNRLQNVSLRGTRITDDSLASFANLPNLSGIDIADTNGHRMHITDAGLDRLTNLPSLMTITLYETDVSDEGIAKLKRRFPAVAVTR